MHSRKGVSIEIGSGLLKMLLKMHSRKGVSIEICRNRSANTQYGMHSRKGVSIEILEACFL